MHRKPQRKHLYRQLINTYSLVCCAWPTAGGSTHGVTSPARPAGRPQAQRFGAGSTPSVFSLHWLEGKAASRATRKQKKANRQSCANCTPQNLLSLRKACRDTTHIKIPAVQSQIQPRLPAVELRVTCTTNQTLNDKALPLFFQTALGRPFC